MTLKIKTDMSVRQERALRLWIKSGRLFMGGMVSRQLWFQFRRHCLKMKTTALPGRYQSVPRLPNRGICIYSLLNVQITFSSTCSNDYWKCKSLKQLYYDANEGFYIYFKKWVIKHMCEFLIEIRCYAIASLKNKL